MQGIEGSYDPKKTEERIYRLWEESGYFSPDKLPVRGKEAYAIHLPPPNITGSLHMGHALNATISDILIRYHRMRGEKTVWFPGIDHAGIATQNVVEKQLKKEGTTRRELGREKFLERVWEWKKQYGTIILEQLKKLGASCDWSRTRFTMDPEYAEWVKKAFAHYYEKGMIYRGKRVVNWCPRCGTGLSDLEIEHKEEKSKLWYIKYPLEKGFILVATTRPETMLGDAAIAVHPKDKRYAALVGKTATLPIQNRKIPVVADDAIDMAFGTGAVKVTPAHDALDSEIAARHKLPFHEIIDERGRMTGEAGKNFEGLKILEAREKVVEELTKSGLIEKIEDYVHNLAICSRCGTTIEPLLSNQWFLKMGELAKKAGETVKSGKTKILPENFEKPYFAWLENIKDWCISRQLWWGHQLPVYFCENGPEKEPKFIVSLEKPGTCPLCKKCNMRQSEDVLDTWFSSALWPLAGLSKKDIDDFYPSNVLITARDIINLWVGRMVFSGLEFNGKTPFPDVLIHATVLTKDGKRMSKSLGTGIDPLGLVEKYGADATRFGIVWQAMGTQDIHWDETAVNAGKKFANKLWNIAKFVAIKTGGQKFEFKNNEKFADEDNELLKKLSEAKILAEKGIREYQPGHALRALYEFVWHEFADKYLEQSKKREDEEVKKILSRTLRECLIMLHPFMPFITEEIWQKFSPGELLIIEKW